MHFLFQWIMKITGWLAQLIILRIKVFYEDKNVQSNRIKGNAIIVANHNTLMDFGIMMFVFWRRTLRCVAAEVLYEKNFFMSLFLFLTGTVKADRNAYDFSFMDRCSDILSKGGVVEIFPEGRLPQEGEQTPLPFKPSAVYLALDTGAPIIPVYCTGASYLSHNTNVVIGKPIDARELYDENLSTKENIAIINDYLRGKIIELQQQFNSEKHKEKQGSVL